MTQTPIPAAPSLPLGSDTGISNTDGIIDIGMPTLIGQSLPGSVITVYDNDFMSVVGMGTADVNGNYDIVLSQALNDGRHRLTVTSQAPGDTVSQNSLPLFVTVDTAAPDLPTAPILLAADDTGASAQDNMTSSNVLHLTGQSEPGATVFLYNVQLTGADPDMVANPIGGAIAAAVVGADGTYTLTTAALADGTYKLGVIAQDVAGNNSKVTKDNPFVYTTITVDTKAPATPDAPTLSPGSDTGSLRTDGLTSADTPTVTGTAEANATVDLYDGTTKIGMATADAMGAYAITASMLEDGPHALTVKAVDAAGNTSAASAPLDIVVQTKAATGTSTPVPAQLGAGSIVFTVQFSEPVTGVTPTDFTLVATNTVSGSVQSVTGSGSTYMVTVSGLDGQGTVGLALVPGSVTGAAGNPATLTESDLHPVSGTTQPSTIEVSVGADGLLGTGTDPSPSASGRLVAFTTLTGSLTTGPAEDGVANVVVKDTLTGAITLVSYDLDGAASDGSSGGASLSADGTELAFASDATNLVDGGTQAGQTNVYLARLTEGEGGPAVTSIVLLSQGNGQQGEGVNDDGSAAFNKPLLSADGSTVAFDSTLALVAGAESGVENVYAENVATGAITLVSGGTGENEVVYQQMVDPVSGETYLQLVQAPDKAPDTGGDFDSDVTSISANGTLIGYESLATDLGGADIDLNAASPPSRGYVYNTTTGDTTVLDGTTIHDPTATVDSPAYQTYGPVLSGDGTKVFYDLHYVSGADQQVQEIYEYSLAAGTTLGISVGASSNGFEVYDYNKSASTGGGLLLFQQNPGVYGNEPVDQATLLNISTGTTTMLTAGFAEALTSSGNAYVYAEEPNGPGSDQLYETNLGVSVGADPVGGRDAIDAGMLTAAAAAGGLAVTGTTNAPLGSTVAVQLFGASATTNTLNSPVVLGTIDGFGHWSAVVPTALLQSADGNYALTVQVGTPAGNSFFSVRDFIVDTVAPAAPDAPKLDAGSDTSSAGDGSATNHDMPIVTGLAEAGATITLYDANSPTPTSPIGTAVADSNGVYAVTPDMPLADGTHILMVTATDAAGNASALSGGDTFIVDTMVPDVPNAPELAVGSDTGADITDHITDNTTPTLVGRAEARSLVTLYDTDGISVLGTATALATGSYSITLGNALSNGVHHLSVTATDAAGNASKPSAAEIITLDTVAPRMPVITTVSGVIVNGGTLGPLVEVDGTAEAGSTVMLQLDGGATDLGMATVGSDGTYVIDSEALPAGPHMLSVIATDAAGNAGQASLQTAVTIADIGGIPPAGSITGVVEDGLLVGTTVFADANDNGTLDSGEVSSVTGADGVWTLNTNDQLPPLVAQGGTDSATGLVLPGQLDAPAGATQVNPLTALLAHLSKVSGHPVTAALIAVENQALGLDPATDLLHVDPIGFANASGDASVLAASTRLMDTAVALADVIAGQTGVTVANAFSAAFDALARAAMAATAPGAVTPGLHPDAGTTPGLDLDDPATLEAIAADAAATASPGAVLPDDVLQGIGILLFDFNSLLDTTTDIVTGVSGPGYVDAVARALQAQAAPLLAAAGSDQTAIDTLLNNFSFQDVIDAELAVLAPPVLAPGQDTGISDADNLTQLTSPIFVGTAPPGAMVALATDLGVNGTIFVGSGLADANGRYSIRATLPAGYNTLLALQVPPGQSTAIGTAVPISAQTLLDLSLQSTLVLVGDLPNGGGMPAIDSVIYLASADAAGGATVYVQGLGADDQQAASYALTADGNPTPIGTDQGVDRFGIVTTPLGNGTHTLVVTETFLDGETLQSQPFTVTISAPEFETLTASAVGAVAGGNAKPFNYQTINTGIVAESYDPLTPYTNTNDAGVINAPLQASAVLGDDGFANAPLLLHGGQDTVTGLAVPDLEAPFGSSVVTPGTTLWSAAIEVDQTTVPVPTLTPALIEALKATITTALGLPDTVDLQTANGLAMAEAGSPALLLKSIEILNTAELLAPFVINPFVTMADIVVANNHGATLGSTIDFTSASQILAELTTYNSTPIFGNNDTIFDASVLPTVATIIAASNAAIETHAAASSDVADTLSYALAVERLVQTNEAVALAEPAADQTAAAQDADFAVLQADYTGTSLDAAIASALAQTVQVTSFMADAPSTSDAITDFTLIFSAPVTNLNEADFTVLPSAGLLGAAVSAVTPVAGSGGTAYTVAVSTGIGAGTLSLQFAPNGLTGSDGRPLTSGLFTAPQTYASSPISSQGFAATSIVTGDFNGDGKADILAAIGGGLTVYLGQGDGTFAAQPTIFDGMADTYGVATGDFNADGKLDVVSFDHLGAGNGTGSPTASIQLGNGDGTFGAPTQFAIGPVGGGIMSIAVGDFNGDGRLDLATLATEPFGEDGKVQVFLGDGSGGFAAQAAIDAGGSTFGYRNPSDPSNYLVASDVNGDGRTDLVVGTSDGPPSVLLGNGDGSFAASTAAGLPQPGVDGGIAVGDLNGDGIADIVSVNLAGGTALNGTSTQPRVTVLLGTPGGGYQPAISVPLPLPMVYPPEESQDVEAIKIADVTGDGAPDIFLQTDGGSIILPGEGDGGFGTGYFVNQGDGNGGPALALADLNGDGRLDLVTAGLTDDAVQGLHGVAVLLNTAQTVLPASAATTIDRAAIADPVLTLSSGPGTLSHVGNAYTLDLGALSQGASVSTRFALGNDAAAPADSFDGIFGAPTGDGFAITGNTALDAIAPGGSYGGLGFAADTGTLGSHSETLLFAPRDTSAGTPAVALELAPLTLTVTDAVVSGTALPPAGLGVLPGSLMLANVRIGDADTTFLSITNTAAAGSADLDVIAAASGDATVRGSVSGLAPQASDTTDLGVGIDSSAAGLRSGTVMLSPASDQGGMKTALPDVSIAAAADVYRPAAAGVFLANAVVHVGDPGTIALSVANEDPADGFSEILDAAIGSVSGGLSDRSGGAAATVAAGSTDHGTLAIGVATAQAGTISGTVTLSLNSDGGTGPGSIDGLGQLALAPDAVPVTVTVDNYAQASLAISAGGGTLQQAAGGYTLDLGTLLQGASAPVIDIAALNTATGPADTLSGSFTITGASAIATDGFGGVGGIGAGNTEDAGSLTLNTGTAGSFSRTIVFDPSGSNASLYIGALAPETLTVLGVVLANTTTLTPAMGTIETAVPIAFGTVHLGDRVTRTLSVANTATPPGAALDAAIAAVSGNATAAGTITELAPGATDTSDIDVGIDTGAVGARSGVATIAFQSESGGTTVALPNQTVAVSGTVFRKAAAAIAPIIEIVHVGSAGIVALQVDNEAADDGYSENLVASLTGGTGAFAAHASGATGEIAAGAGDGQALTLGFSTATSGTLSGTAQVSLISDGGLGGGSIDGLGQTVLAPHSVPVSITVDNFAAAAITSNGALTSDGNGNYTLDLGSAAQGSAALSANLTTSNAATGTADWLSGAYLASEGAGYANAGFGTFSNLAAGASINAGTVSLSTAQIGTFTETLTLDPVGGNAGGFSAALAARTVTVTGTITSPTGVAWGDVHLVAFDGLHYDFQATGDFVLARATDPARDYQIQIHTDTLPGIAGVSWTTAIGAELDDGERVNFVAGAASILSIDGRPDTLAVGGSRHFIDGSKILRLSADSYQLVWAAGETLEVTDRGNHFDLSAALSPADRPGAVQGLLGSDSGPANDIALPDGSVLAQPLAAATLLGTFADAWRVAPSQSLLDPAGTVQWGGRLDATPLRFITQEDAQISTRVPFAEPWIPASGVPILCGGSYDFTSGTSHDDIRADLVASGTMDAAGHDAMPSGPGYGQLFGGIDGMFDAAPRLGGYFSQNVLIDGSRGHMQ